MHRQAQTKFKLHAHRLGHRLTLLTFLAAPVQLSFSSPTFSCINRCAQAVAEAVAEAIAVACLLLSITHRYRRCRDDVTESVFPVLLVLIGIVCVEL